MNGFTSVSLLLLAPRRGISITVVHENLAFLPHSRCVPGRRPRAAPLVGQASVVDGDRLEIRGVRIRLFGVDAPESAQTCLEDGAKLYRCGQKAALALSDFIAAKLSRARLWTQTATGGRWPRARWTASTWPTELRTACGVRLAPISKRPLHSGAEGGRARRRRHVGRPRVLPRPIASASSPAPGPTGAPIARSRVAEVRMCNLYSMTKNQAAIRNLFKVDCDNGGNQPSLPGIFPDYPAPIVRNADGGRELTMARWGMPSSSKALMDATASGRRSSRSRASRSTSRGCCGWSPIAGPPTS
jgi:hypothetical protein